MSIRIGSARHDENGKLTGGRPGDQTGTEVSMQNFYVHKNSGAGETLLFNKGMLLQIPAFTITKSSLEKIINLNVRFFYPVRNVTSFQNDSCNNPARTLRIGSLQDAPNHHIETSSFCFKVKVRLPIPRAQHFKVRLSKILVSHAHSLCRLNGPI